MTVFERVKHIPPDGFETEEMLKTNDVVFKLTPVRDLNGTNFMFSVWAQATTSTNITISGGTVSVTEEVGTAWKRITTQLLKSALESTADITISVQNIANNGCVYFYKAKLESGTRSTDWTPAPEDMEEEIGTINSQITQLADEIELRVTSEDFETVVTLLDNKITSTVEDTEKNLQSVIEQTAEGVMIYVREASDKAGEALESAESKISDIEVQYRYSDSETELIGDYEWSAEAPPWQQNKYIWTRTKVEDGAGIHYSPSEMGTCISGAKGEPGSSGAPGRNTAIVYLYKRSTTTPTIDWGQLTYNFENKTLTTVPTGWSQTIPNNSTAPIYVTAATASSVNNTDTIASSEWVSPPALLAQSGADGEDGEDGTNGLNTATIFLYKRINSIPSKPSATLIYSFSTGALEGDLSDWSRSVPTINGNPCWITQATAISSSSTYSIASTNWSAPVKLVEDGENGIPGLNGAIVYLYKRSISTPTIDWTNDLTYVFADKSLKTIPSGWYATIPTNSINPLYVTAATASSSGAEDTISYNEWSTPALLAQNGVDGINGLNNAALMLYKRADSVPTGTAAKPTSTLTYTFASGAITEDVSGGLNGWSKIIPSGNSPCWVIQATAASKTAIDTIPVSEWSSPPVKIVENGVNGENGDNGNNTAIVYLYKRSESAPSIDWTNTLTYNFEQKQLTSEPSGWSKVMVTGTDPLYVTAATAYGNGSTDTIPYTDWCTPVLLGKNGIDGQDGKDGADGQDGSDGLNSATIVLYKRAQTEPTGTSAKPSGAITYTFATGSVSGSLNDWSKTMPSGSDPCWTIQATAISASDTDTIAISEWSSPPAKMVEDGARGDDGNDGKNTAIVYLYKRSTAEPTIDWTSTLTYNFDQKQLTSVPSGWSKTMPIGTNPLYATAATASGTGSTDTIAYTEWCTPVLIGKNGENGQDGRDGTDGVDGKDGADGLNSATVLLYKRSATVPTSSAAKPSETITYTFASGSVSGNLNGWSKIIPTGTDPCWVIQATAASTGTTDTIPVSEWTTPAKLVEDGVKGEPGTDGKNTAIVYLYKRSTSAPSIDWSTTLTYNFDQKQLTSVPSGWYKAIPSGTDPLYVTAATAYASGSTDTIASSEWAAPVLFAKNGTNGTNGTDGQDGRDGTDGNDGLNCATVMLYKRAATVPTSTAAKPSGTITYTFATGAVSGSLNEWTKAIPDGTNPCWVIQATVASTSATDTILTTEWNTPTKLVEDGANGADGNNTALVYLYKRATATPTIDWTNDLTYNFSQKAITSTIPSGWYKAIPSGDEPLYVTIATAYSNGTTDTIAYNEWSTPVLLAQNGTNGINGTNGLNSATVYLYMRSSSTPSKPSNSLVYTFSTGVITGFLGNWQATIPSGSNPCWIIQTTAVSTEATYTIVSTQWSAPQKLAENGAKGDKGDAGETGQGVTAIKTQYYLSTSSSSQVGGSWSEQEPAWTSNHYIWTRSEITWTNSTQPTYTDPILAKAYNTAQSTAAAAQSAASSAQSTAAAASSAASSAQATASDAQSMATAAKDEIDSLQIGGRNLLLKSSYEDTNFSSFDANSLSGYGFVKSGTSTTPVIFGQIDNLSLVPNTDYIVSFVAWIDGNGSSSAKQALEVDLYPDSLPQKGYDWQNGITVTPTKYEWKLKSSLEAIKNCSLRFFNDQVTAYSGNQYYQRYTIYITDIKLEAGNRATDWTPSPQDIYDEVVEVSSVEWKQLSAIRTIVYPQIDGVYIYGGKQEEDGSFSPDYTGYYTKTTNSNFQIVDGSVAPTVSPSKRIPWAASANLQLIGNYALISDDNGMSFLPRSFIKET